MLLLVIVMQASQWRPIQRGYPRTISAVLVPKGAKGTAPSGANPAPAGASVTAPQPPAEKKAEPPKQETPRPEVAKERVDKNATRAVSIKSPPPAQKRKVEQEKTPGSGTPAPASTSSPAARSGGGRIGAGSGTGGVARVDGPEFPFPHYIALLQFRIENQWQPAYLGAGQFLATVHFVIAKSGKILSAELEQSSGNFTFDQAALRAVHNANPLPPLPEGVGTETLGVHFDFVANW